MLIYYSFYIIFVISTSIYLKKNAFFSNYSGDKHQFFSNKKNIPLSGGILLIAPLVLIFIKYPIFDIFLIFIFFIGFLSDRKLIISAKKRFIFQIFLIIAFVLFSDLKIISSRLEFFDNLLQNNYFAYFFSSFCLLILINGSNFIDGLNGMLILYVIIVISLLLKLDLISFFSVKDQNFIFLLILLSVLLVLNFMNYLMLGDNGAYILSFLLGFIIIKSHNLNSNVSPYFFILLIWYPCFENFFSILRKYFQKISPLEADNLHFHQLLFFYIKKKLKLSIVKSNNLSSILINFFNILVVSLGSIDIYNTKFQIQLIFLNLILYIIFYNFFLRYHKLIKLGKK
tara:strand:+ start:3651 stop:4676 length:1026 start_codon:yes stop_codon:yes gene_type:complete